MVEKFVYSVPGNRFNFGLTLNRPGFLQIGMARGGENVLPPCNFCLNGRIDLKLGM